MFAGSGAAARSAACLLDPWLCGTDEGTHEAPVDLLEHLRILALLGEDEVCVCHIHDSLRLPQPTVSRHLATLRRSGLVTARREGLWMHYRLSRELDAISGNIVHAALDGLRTGPVAVRDRKQFQRSFGQLYVLESPEGGTCCAPGRARERT